MSVNINTLGWDSFFEESYDRMKTEGLLPARVFSMQKKFYRVLCVEGELTAEVSGKLHHTAFSRSDLPVVGDWVIIHPSRDGGNAIIHARLPRKTVISRKNAGDRFRRSGGKTEEQSIAANVDSVFLVSGLDQEFHPRRIERYLAMVTSGGAEPVIILNKIDLREDWENLKLEIEILAPGIPVHCISAKNHQGIEELQGYLQPGRTVALLGSSGVGKSTIINSLIGCDRQKVKEISGSTGKGRHMTTTREMMFSPMGGLLMDHPGMRELQLWGDQEFLQGAFKDIKEFARGCRFRDCRHQKEPGCEVRRAIDIGRLDEGRLQNYLKLERELEYLDKRKYQKPNVIEREKWKRIINDNSG